MNNSCSLVLSLLGLCLLNGCGGGGSGSTTSPATATHFTVTAEATATAGTAFPFTVTALDASNNVNNGYSGTVHFSSSDGQAMLPTNSALTNGTGTFSATLKTLGSQTITATDTVTASITGTSNSINASAGAATHFSVTPTTSTATAGTAFNFTVSALDASNSLVTHYSGTVHFSSSDGQAVLPTNSTLTSGTGTFSATMNTVGSQTITATDTVTALITGSSLPISVTTATTLTITSGTPPGGTVLALYGEPHRLRDNRGMPVFVTFFQLTATGGTGHYSWAWAAAQGSSLPPGLGCCDHFFGTQIPPRGVFVRGAIFGIPTTLGTYHVVVTVTDTGSPAAEARANYTITIAPPPPPTISSTPAPAIGTLNVAYVGFTFTATDGLPPFAWTEKGALPTGMSFSSAGVLSGTPTAAGSFPITVQVQDSLGRNAAQDLMVHVLNKGFVPTGSLADPRVLHVAALLPSGKVLITGGINTTVAPLTAELYDPATGSFVPTKGNMATSRVSATATVLHSGKVLVIGGKGPDGNPVATAEIYDPASDTFAATTGGMQTTRVYHTATLLKDGTVLVTGGLDVSGNLSGVPIPTAELFDPATNHFTPVANMSTGRFLHAATLLASGRLLVTGGLQGTALTTAELYDPATKTFSLTIGNMTAGRVGQTATLLGGGKVLVAGGAPSFGGAAASTAELFDPATAIFSPTGAMVTARSLHTATLLSNGQVLMAGGDAFFYNRAEARSLSAAELFDPASGSFTSTADLTTVRESHTATLLLNGEVLVVGGADGTLGYSATTIVLATAELHQ